MQAAGMQGSARTGWIAPAVALALACAVGFGVQMMSGARESFIAAQRVGIEQFIAAPAMAALPAALAALKLWALAVVAPFVVMLGLFLLLEVALTRQPPPWRRTAFAFGLFALSLAIMAVVEPVIRAVWPAAITPVFRLGPDDLPAGFGFAAPLVLAVVWLVAFDFFQYWVHRAQHAIPALWRFHAVHHSHEHMDSTNAFSHPVDAIGVLLGVLAFGAMVGFDAAPVIYLAAILTIRDRLIHTRAPIHFGPLHPWLIDNRHHFLHHSPDPACHHCNFGSTFTLWDKLYGTYRAPQRDALGPTGLHDAGPVRSVRGYLLAELPARK
jgi:sterol desaturase/sphingolipid hydroxylase (fatty acid hydroxylase superfamily)